MDFEKKKKTEEILID